MVHTILTGNLAGWLQRGSPEAGIADFVVGAEEKTRHRGMSKDGRSGAIPAAVCVLKGAVAAVGRAGGAVAAQTRPLSERTAAGGFAPEIDPHKTPFLTAVTREIVGYARIAVTVEERGSGRAVELLFADLQYASASQRYGDLPADLKRDQSVRKLRDAVSLSLHLFHDDVRVRHLLELNILFYSGYRVGHYRETISRKRYISEIIWKANGALMQSGQHLHEIRRCSLGTGMFSCDLIYGSQ